MKNLIKYDLYEEENPYDLTKDQVDFLNKHAGDWELNLETGLVDCHTFNCIESDIIDFKGINFGECRASFVCRNNKLKSLEGSPKKVGGGFDCSNNNLSSLEGAPSIIYGNFKCTGNFITSLENGPKDVTGDFNCEDNQIKTLKDSPKIVGGSFNCNKNELISLEGAPNSIFGNFRCSQNKLTTLEKGPKKVTGSFICMHNKLTSLKGLPEKMGELLDCRKNPLKSLEYLPLEIGDIYSDFEESTVEIIRKYNKPGTNYSEILIKIWSQLPDQDKKKLVSGLPNSSFGNTIKTANKFGMNI